MPNAYAGVLSDALKSQQRTQLVSGPAAQVTPNTPGIQSANDFSIEQTGPTGPTNPTGPTGFTGGIGATGATGGSISSVRPPSA